MNVRITPKNRNSVDMNNVESIASKLGLNKKFVELMCLRGIDSIDAVNKFLYPTKEQFYDPFSMKGMHDAVERITQAIENGEKVVIYGDYDADGVCAASILSLYLSKRGLDVFVHIPNRVGDGYGLNTESLSRIIENHMPDLIITCDCGISGFNEVRFVLDLGVDIIVTDHHEISCEVPECTVVNPKQEDCAYPFDQLCGAGVALKLIQALDGVDEMLIYTDLACVATIADLVPLTDENRLIVQFGLKRLNEKKNLGLSVMFDDLALENITSGDIAYKIAPRINAAGRMGDAYRAFELLTSTDVGRIKQIADEINADNARRKEMGDEMYGEASEDLAFENLIDNRAIVLSHPSWEKGITGILAARLAGDYNRPAFITVKSGESYKGTCRSVEGINIHDLLLSCRDYLIEFGGHSQAAGFSIMPDKIDDFRKAVNEYLATFPDELFLPKASFDMEITTEDVDYDFVRALDLLEPTGNGNTKPLFKINISEAKISPCKNNGAHISVILDSGFQIFAFNYSKLAYQLMSPGEKALVTELQTSNFGGKQIKGIMRCCSPSELYINDSICVGYPYELLNYLPKDNCKYSLYDESELNSLTGNLYGTLVIAFNRDSYEKYVSSHEKPAFREFLYPTSRNNFSRIIVAPSFAAGNLSFANYNRIIFLDAPLNNGIISYLNSVTKAEIFLPNEIKENYDLSVERDVCVKYFEAIRACANIPASSLNVFFKHASQKYPELQLRQFIFCVKVFEELGFIKITESPFSLNIVKGVKADLTMSKIYCMVGESV